MNHQWRPWPMQGNICPTCSTSHFPFCPPLPNPRLAYGAPNFNPQYSMQQPIYSNTGEPYRDPHYWSRNPNIPGETFHNLYQFPQPFPGDLGVRDGHPTHSFSHGVNMIGSEYNNVNDRSSKRLRVEGPDPASYSTEAHENSSMVLPNENERRLKLIRDHGSLSDARHDGSYAGVSGKRFKTDAYQYGQTASPSGGYHGYQHKTHGSNGFPGENLHNGFLHSEPHFEVHAHLSVEKGSLGNQPPKPFATGHFDKMDYGYPGRDGYTIGSQYGHPDITKRGGYNNVIRPGFIAQPPLPSSPPPPPPPPPNPIGSGSASAKTSVSLFPIQDKSSVATHCSFRPSEAQSPGQHYNPSSRPMHASRGLFPQDSPGAHASANQYFGEGQLFLSKTTFSDVPKAIDISNLFSMPRRVTRPDHFVIILRGLPGSGKSYLAKMLRDLEVEHGGSAPRIHSMDDYFMTEVEVEDNEVSKSSVRAKKSAMKTVLEYCYEPEMEEAYRSSMLKAFKKTLEEGTFTIVIVDDRNLRVADFAQFWATAKRLGYEVYLLEAPYKDPAGCTARNIHNFTQDDIEKMARQWEDAPSLYVKLDPKALFSGDDLKESNIQEVDMDMEDEDVIRGASESDQKKHEKIDSAVAEEEYRPGGSSKDEKKWDVEADNLVEVKDLGQSKWSSNLDDDEDDEGTETAEGKPAALSGLFKAYGKGGKSVHWGDQAANVGFSIGSAKKSNMASLVIGPGTGYNLNSNPLRDDEVCSSVQQKKKHSGFQEQLRAERESFRAVFDRRKHRIGGLDAEDE